MPTSPIRSDEDRRLLGVPVVTPDPGTSPWWPKALAAVMAAAVLGGSGYLVGSRRAPQPRFVVFRGSAAVQDPAGDVWTVAHNSRPRGSPSYDLKGASLTIHGSQVEVVLRSDQPIARAASARLSGTVTMDEDASHPLYSISFNAHDMDIRDSAAFQNFGLAAGQGKGTACQEEDCDWETPVLDQFDTRVRRGFTVSGDTITISLSRRDLPRLPPFFYWKVWLTENADNSSQASFDDFVPNGKDDPLNYASIFPDGYARFPN